MSQVPKEIEPPGFAMVAGNQTYVLGEKSHEAPRQVFELQHITIPVDRGEIEAVDHRTDMGDSAVW